VETNGIVKFIQGTIPPMFRWLKSRWLHVKSIGKVWWLVVGGAWGAFWVADEVIAKWGSPSTKATWDKYTLHFPLDWKIGLIVMLAILVVLLIEGSFRNHQKTIGEHEKDELNAAKAHENQILELQTSHAKEISDRDTADNHARELATLREEVVSTHSKSRDWPADWRLMEDGFRRYSKSTVRADYQGPSPGVPGEWRLCGDDCVKDVEAFCFQAGKLLSISPLDHPLPEDVAGRASHVSRWLYFLKDKYGLTRTNYVVHESDGKSHTIMFGSLENLATVSARACVECAALSF
jgi:hypothetical protein